MARFKMTVSHAAEKGSRRDLLVALRSRLAEAMEDERTQPRDLSPISLRLRELQAEIETLDAIEPEGLPVGDEPFNVEEI